MSLGITCKCEECHYNKNYKCDAETIIVRSMGDMKCESSEGTCCHTFKHK